LTDQQYRLQSTAQEPERLGRPQPTSRAARLWQLRLVRFGTVAGSCTLLQLLLLAGLVHLGLDQVIANGIGFALSAQLNFVLSARLTWRDRQPRHAAQARSATRARVRAWGPRWASFNVIAVAALAVNELVFALATHGGAPLIAASLLGIVTGAAVTFTANHLVTFRRSPAERTAAIGAEHRPALDEIRARARQDGVAFFLPAYNEAANLRTIVPRTVAYFDHLACPFTVTIVDDGSTKDDTFETAEQLAHAYPGVVQAVHHPQNRGYGAALHSGIRAGLKTGHGLIAFCDADGQFDIESFGTLVAALQDAQADLSAGYRIARADSLARRLMGRGWHWLSSVVLGFTAARDVDCGFKVFTRPLLRDLEPQITGDYAAVSPELLARAVSADYTVTEAGITHRPRVHGEQTGARPKVVLFSLIRLFRLRLTLRQAQAQAQAQAQPQVRARPGPAAAGMPERAPRRTPRDKVAWAVGGAATLLSVLAYAVTDRLHGVLLYADSISHLEIARRVVSGTSPGLAQLGYVWLPLPHLLMLPLVWIDPLYHNGFAGSAVSMVAYIAATVLIYKITYRLARQKLAGVVAAAVFALNVNMLYMQSTPMTEALLFCLLAAMVYCVQQWADTDRYQYLVWGGVTAAAATLTRYESWPVLACLLLAVAFIAWHRQRGQRDLRLRLAGGLDRLVAFAVVAFSGVLAWVIWNWAIFGSPLDFQDGTYAKPSNWVSKGEPAIGHWMVAIKTYWFAMLDNETLLVLLLAAAGLACVIAREWRTVRGVGRSLPVLSLLVLLPFFVLSLYSGQRPLHVPQIEGDFYNVRFGLIMLVPAAIGAGYLVGVFRRWRPVAWVAAGLVLALTVSLGVSTLRKDNVVTFIAARETLTSQPVLAQDTIAYLNGHYTGGLVLMESFGNERIAFQLPSSQLVYEGSYRQWRPSLRDPAANHIDWIIARCGNDPSPDQVCLALGRRQLGPYQQVYVSPGRDYRVYRLRK
jgi:putative flippase GtrA